MPYAFYVVRLQEMLLNAQTKEAAEQYQAALADLARNLVSTVYELQLKGYIIRTIQPESKW